MVLCVSANSKCRQKTPQKGKRRKTNIQHRANQTLNIICFSQTDRQSQRSFETPEAARTAALEIKSRFPALQVSIYDSVSKSRTVIALPSFAT
jgi:hypothetical protein